MRVLNAANGRLGGCLRSKALRERDVVDDPIAGDYRRLLLVGSRQRDNAKPRRSLEHDAERDRGPLRHLHDADKRADNQSRKARPTVAFEPKGDMNRRLCELRPSRLRAECYGSVGSASCSTISTSPSAPSVTLRWMTAPELGAASSLTSSYVRVLQPGQPNCLYHSESLQEDFLVLAGECVLLVDGEERPLRAWDFVHCPAGTEHVFVGAGDGPSVILMAGARDPEEKLLYPASELAKRYGASAETETASPEEAYASFGPSKEGRPQSWDQLPWA
jgi:uncharacterized cupin superfamily protein